MRHINYKSDFALEQRLYYEDPETRQLKDMGFPPFNFKLYYYTTSRANAYVASCTYEKKHIVKHDPHHKPHDRRGNESYCEHYDSEHDEYEVRMVNCRNENGTILVVFDNHNLACGELKVEVVFDIPDNLFPDGRKKEVLPYPTDVLLWTKPTDGYPRAEAMAVLPYIKGTDGKDGKDGKDFTYEDLTSEQIEDFAEKVADKVIDDNVSEKIEEAIDKKMGEEFDEIGDITDEEFDEMFHDK